MTPLTTVDVMHAKRDDVRGPYLFDGDDVADFYTYRENEHGQRASLVPYPGAEHKARFAAAAWNSYTRLAARIGCDPLKLAEADVLGALWDAAIDSHHPVCRDIQSRCRQTNQDHTP